MTAIEDESVNEILEIFRRSFNSKEILNLGINQINGHGPELRQLKNSNNPHLCKEIADIYLWAKILMRLEQVNQGIVDERALHFLDKIKGIYSK